MCERIITLNHSSIFRGYQAVIQMYLTINEKFFIPDVVHYTRVYIKGCHIFQLHRNKKPQPRQLQHIINPNYRAMMRLSMDLKVMPQSYKCYKFILVGIDEITNSMVTIPIFQSTSDEIGYALIEHVFNSYSIPDCMIIDHDSAFMSTLIDYLFKKLGIRIKTVDHQSLQAEHGIRSLTSIPVKHLTGLGQYWPKYLPFARYS